MDDSLVVYFGVHPQQLVAWLELKTDALKFALSFEQGLDFVENHGWDAGQGVVDFKHLLVDSPQI